MSLVKWAFVGLLVLPAAEIATFILAAQAIGWAGTIAFFLATSLIGVIVLRRSGRRDLDRFLAVLARDGVSAIHLETPGLAAIIGGILLVVPGFITDLAGALLFVTPVRRWASMTIGRALRRRRRDPPTRTVIDLSPDQWRQLPDGRLEDNRSRKRGS